MFGEKSNVLKILFESAKRERVTTLVTKESWCTISWIEQRLELNVLLFIVPEIHNEIMNRKEKAVSQFYGAKAITLWNSKSLLFLFNLFNWNCLTGSIVISLHCLFYLLSKHIKAHDFFSNTHIFHTEFMLFTLCSTFASTHQTSSGVLISMFYVFTENY